MQIGRRCDLVKVGFYQDQNKWKYKFILVEISQSNSDRIVDLLIYRNHTVLIKTLFSLLSNHKYIFV